MNSFWRRHRRKLVAAAAVGVAGAAAAYWWYSSEEQAEHQEQEAKSHLRRTRWTHPAAAVEQQQQQQPPALQQQQAPATNDTRIALDESLSQHFASIQEISDRQALEDLLPRLQDELLRSTDYEPLRAALRAGGLAPQEKLALWERLATESFTRALGAAWLVPLLDLLVRLKLHIVGRHMYLESRLPQLQPPGTGTHGSLPGLLGPSATLHPAAARTLGAASPRGPFGRVALPPCLSDRAKEEFLRCDYFIDTGAPGLLLRLRAATAACLQDVDFGGSATQQDVEALFAHMHASFDSTFAAGDDLWSAYLLPQGPTPLSTRTGSGVEALLSPVEAAMLDELNAELREVLGDYRFVDALRAAVRHASRGLGAYVASKLAPQQAPATATKDSSILLQGDGGQGLDQGRPFPYIVPVVAKSGGLLFGEAGRCTKGISGLREVQALCASVFTFAPHIC